MRQRMGDACPRSLTPRATSPDNKKFPFIKLFGFSQLLLLDEVMHDVDVMIVCRQQCSPLSFLSPLLKIHVAYSISKFFSYLLRFQLWSLFSFSNFFSWFFYKILIRFQFYHSISIYNMLFFSIWSLFFVKLIFLFNFTF